jgi:effector-binding domain-containing protein
MASSIQVTVKDTEPLTVAFLSKKGPYTQISAAFGQLYGWIGQKGYTPTGPPTGVYFNAPGQVPDDQLAWELRSPIAGKVSPSGPDKDGLGVKQVATIKVAATMHKGSFETVGKTYEALVGWIMQNGYDIAGPSEEVYISDPSKTPPQELLTEVRFPVRKR